MADSRRSFVKKALAAGGAIASSASFISTARADNCAKQTRLLGFGASFGDGQKTVYHLSIPDWGLGDCELRNVKIDFPVGTGIGTFKGEVGTHFTHHEDVWHFRLELFTGEPAKEAEQAVLFDQSWDGPQMSERDQPLFHPWQFQFSISPAIDLGKVYARATSCC
jgi:hypothetical protein